MSKNVEFEDIHQQAWMSFLRGVRRFDGRKNTTLGAYCRSWCWGGCYRYLCGSKAIHQQTRMSYGYDATNVIDNSVSEELVDLINIINSLPPKSKQVVELAMEGKKPSLISQEVNILITEVKKILSDFKSLLSDVDN